MPASFRTFAATLGYKPAPTLSALSVCRALGFSPKISLKKVMTQIGAPVTPTQLSANVIAGESYQFGWSDPSAFLDKPAPSQLIREATSFVFELWLPAGAAVTENFQAVGPSSLSGQSFFWNGNGTWAYNDPGAINAETGAYSWRVWSVNDYGSTVSPMQHIGTNAPHIWFTVNSNQTEVTVFGADFPDSTCTVVATCSMFKPSSNTGDITKGVTVAIVCQNEGQYWTLTVTGAGGGTATGQVNCSGGAFP
jgi:hypothetical protein